MRHAGRSLAPPGGKRQGLLALLLLGRSRPVPVDRLVEGLWGESPPASAVNLVQTYVSVWRRILRAELGAEEAERRLGRTAAGYQLTVERGELDVDRFERTWQDGRRAFAAGRTAEAAEILATAMAEWSGEPLAGLEQEPFHEWYSSTLVDVRRQCLLHWAAAAVSSGRSADVLAPLRDTLRDDPLREDLAAALMRALLAEHRTAEALAVFEDTRRELADQLGVDPGSELQAVHLQAVRQEPPARVPRAVPSPAPSILPVPADSFVGREAEIRELRRLVADRRLVTLTGPGGAGKTRLAVELARSLVAQGGAVAFVDAVPLVEARQLPDRIAVALGVQPAGGESTSSALVRELASRHVLVVLDNLEHLAEASQVVGSLLAGTEHVHVLATSREPLGLSGEQRYLVRPLPADATGAAVELFLERARAVAPEFAASNGNRRAVVELCRRLDGLPLAIELAAAWMGTVSPQALLGYLAEDRDVLVDPSGGRPERHSSLRALLADTVAHLDEPERALLGALSVFRGSATAESAAAVAALPAVDVLLALRRLTARGLVDVLAADRYRLLDTVREFVVRQASSAAEHAGCTARFAEFFGELAATAATQLAGADQAEHLATLERERDNIEEALLLLAEKGEESRALRTAAGLWRWWQLRSHLDDGERLLAEVLRRAGPTPPAAARAAVVVAQASLAYWRRNYPLARQRYEQGTSLAESAGDVSVALEGLFGQAYVALIRDDRPAAQRLFADLAGRAGELGDELWLAHALVGSAVLELADARVEQARRSVVEARGILQRRGDAFSVANALLVEGSVLRTGRALPEAVDVLVTGTRAHAELGHALGVAWGLHELADVALLSGEPERALVLSGAASSLEAREVGGIAYEVIRLPEIAPADVADVDPRAAHAAWDRGRAMTPEEAVAFATASTRVPDPLARREERDISSL